MDRLRLKIKNRLPSGLMAKMIYAVIRVAFILGILFFILSTIQIHILLGIVEDEGIKMTEKVGEQSRSVVNNLTHESLYDLSIRAADKTDDEFWVNSYELEILAAQAQDVLSHPENYGRRQLNPPDPANQGELTLQLLAPDGYENIPEETLATLERLANLAPIMESYIGQYTVDFYIAAPDGTAIAMDRFSADKLDENGQIRAYDASQRSWFTECVKEGGLHISPPDESFFRDYDIVVYSLPVYVDGRLGAVLEGSLRVDAIVDRVDAVEFGDSGFSILVNDDGQLVATTENARGRGELAMPTNSYEDIRTTVNPELAEAIDKGIRGEADVCRVKVDGRPYYAGYAPLVTVGWTQIAFVSVDEMLGPTKRIVEDAEASYHRMYRHVDKGFHYNMLIMLIVMLVLGLAICVIIGKFAVKQVEPILQMTKRVREISGEHMIFEMEDIYRTGDELETLASAFADQSVRLVDYMEENIRITTEKDRLDFELSMATQIQESMLPKLVEAFSGRDEFELYAHMAPAKNVGGDFYDFFYLDDDHLVIEVADVSGKGITAALFMAQSMQIIRAQMVQHQGDVVKAMSAANVQMTEESMIDMFVTVWLGVLTISTGELAFVDAGHEYPAIKRGKGNFVIEEDAHSMIAGAFETAKFELNKITLEPEDVIFLYTDGVTEAHNAEDGMFEESGLEAALCEIPNGSPEEIDRHVRLRIDEFAGEMEQYDDITTLCLRYKGKASAAKTADDAKAS